MSERDTRSNNIMSDREPDLIMPLIYHLLSPFFTSLTIFRQTFFIQGITLIEKVYDYWS